MQISIFLQLQTKKRANTSLKKADIYQHCDRRGTKLSSMYGTALLTEKNFQSAAQLKRNKFLDFSPQRNFCALPTSDQ